MKRMTEEEYAKLVSRLEAHDKAYKEAYQQEIENGESEDWAHYFASGSGRRALWEAKLKQENQS